MIEQMLLDYQTHPDKISLVFINQTSAALKNCKEFLNLIIVASFFSIIIDGCKSFEPRDSINNPSRSNTSDEIYFVANIKWIPLEGGFYGLEADDGRRFLPLKLPDEFKKQGLKVGVKGKIKKVYTIYMWGKPFEIHEIDYYTP